MTDTNISIPGATTMDQVGEPSNNNSSRMVVSESPAFPEEPIDECVRIRTRVFFPNPPPPPISEDGKNQAGGCNDHIQIRNNVLIPSNTCSTSSASANANANAANDGDAPYAYMILNVIRETIYGHLYQGQILKRRNTTTTTINSSSSSSSYECEWEATETYCAIKEMEWEKIHHGQETGMSENPLREMAAMQYLKNHSATSTASNSTTSTTNDDTRLMTALDILSDEWNLYCIMPFLDRGDLFDVMDDYITSLQSTNNKEVMATCTTPSSGSLPESECRYWFKEILCAVEEMHKVGICHRDLSLENIMVGPNRRAMIIDWGMCIRIPTTCTFDKFGREERCLIATRERCGKNIYMSPEVYNSVNGDEATEPYDTHALDLWSVGVILLSMSIGDFQWEIPDVVADERFRLLTNGDLAFYLREWDMGLSEELMDLLQGMLMVDPDQRFGIEDIWKHPWMMRFYHRN